MRGSPQQIGTVLAELIARRGWARLQSAARLEAVWRQAAGPAAERFTRVQALRRGRLEVIVSHSTFLQELAFRKAELLASIRRLLRDEAVRDIRFRLGHLE
ncbi:MAG: DciA family protein [Thermoguttaceae bacterium]